MPGAYEEHAKLMFDLQVLAYQTDLTRVITFMMGREIQRPDLSARSASPDAHHPISHHQNDAEKIARRHQDQHLPHDAVLRTTSTSCGPRQTATARCWITC